MNVVRKIPAFLFALISASLITCAPATAQSSSPSAAQYADCSSSELAEGACAAALDVGDGADTVAENAGQGTDAVNEAMTGAEASAASSASPSASPESETVASITRLPETGGAPAAALGSGALLVLLGLAIRRIF
jgi:hypothetical protein